VRPYITQFAASLSALRSLPSSTGERAVGIDGLSTPDLSGVLSHAASVSTAAAKNVQNGGETRIRVHRNPSAEISSGEETPGAPAGKAETRTSVARFG